MMFVKYLKLFHAFLLAFWILWIKFPHLNKEQKLFEIQNWSRKTLEVLGIGLESAAHFTQSFHSQEPKLLVANHVSWVDVLIIQAIQPSVFVAKIEVKKWPFVGPIATACGVIYVKRGSPSSARNMVDDVAQALHHGYCVAGFPEGTSSEGSNVQFFHANLFEAALYHDIAIQPLALRYTHPTTGELCTKAAFIGELGFLQSLHQVISAKGIVAKVYIGEMLLPQGHSRRSLAQLSQRTISTQLALLSA
jgi:1-acyl-sn-glycerol-3-phosphate acyltransferase